MRLGYSFWGFLGDMKFDENMKELSTPDGNATYSWSIIHGVQKRAGTVYLMQEDRDKPGWDAFGENLFSSFAQKLRTQAYENCIRTPNKFPELDVLLIEWRFPIPGRNCMSINGSPYITITGEPEYQEGNQDDLYRQWRLLEHYKQTKTKIIIWDLDHKLTQEDERRWNPDAIFETSLRPVEGFVDRTSVMPPVVIDSLREHKIVSHDQFRKLVYIGSRYERDDAIDRYIKPVSEKFKRQVEFYGNWRNTIEELQKKWPHILYNKRVTVKDFHEVYSTAVACPLLAKESYFRSGFITPRVFETLMFGTIPIGFEQHNGIHEYINSSHVVNSGEELCDLLQRMSWYDTTTRERLRNEAIEKIQYWDVKNFVNSIEEV